MQILSFVRAWVTSTLLSMAVVQPLITLLKVVLAVAVLPRISGSLPHKLARFFTSTLQVKIYAGSGSCIVLRHMH